MIFLRCKTGLEAMSLHDSLTVFARLLFIVFASLLFTVIASEAWQLDMDRKSTKGNSKQDTIRWLTFRMGLLS